MLGAALPPQARVRVLTFAFDLFPMCFLESDLCHCECAARQMTQKDKDGKWATFGDLKLTRSPQ